MSLEAQIQVRVGLLEVSLEFGAAAGETIAILGPNGAGKTTLVRALAGLQPIDAGRIVLDGRVLDQRFFGVSDEIFVPPEQRSAGVVFQDVSLFPHLSALGNVAFALEASGVTKRVAERKALAHLESLSIGALADSRPSSLSGGEAQRVALARALIRQPRMLLLDEPLASLDVTTRNETRRTLRGALDSFDGVRVLVTHAISDVAALATRVLVLEDGRVTQVGSLKEVLASPASEYVQDLVANRPND